MSTEIVAQTLPLEAAGKPIPAEYRNRRMHLRAEEITVGHIERFLVELASTGLWYQSSEVCGLSYATIRRLVKDDPEFKEWCEEALQSYKDSLEKECHRRAVQGW